ncbi:hypothetical protein ABB37_00556 [Leptomonas pyrrhocoris]|uniref:Thioredoxin domain-containing protein n=1 Tax=Leptomonas pyrrhocoris TaxID=157538 RepID=A0A0N0VHX7_LEPPY|nr:hypothetical protein ABB37_00556 [Leptomonas pyrrhocoris]KPA86361.1 hypothetical protein ABB37_00556 [Leptomonas pyrrhocoris]|eukprot:XP_015664800.1 hypothetical protein ABB37_00556 [Leptomonas pyrrhocoris]
MPRGRSLSAKSKGSKRSALPPPPPPVILRVNTVKELEREVLTHAGAALVVVVSPLTPSTTDAMIAALEQLNSSRPQLLAEMHFVVVYALQATKEVCEALAVSSLPFVRCYAYGDVVSEFSGDNTEKMALLAKLAATAAAQKAALLAEKEKQRHAEAEAAAAAAMDGAAPVATGV